MDYNLSSPVASGGESFGTESQRLYNAFVSGCSSQSMSDLGYLRHVMSNINSRLLNNQRFSDIAFQVSKFNNNNNNNQKHSKRKKSNKKSGNDFVLFYGIKALFACQSPVLEHILYSDMNRMFTIKLDGITSDTFDFLMKYCYGLNPVLTIDNVTKILHCSEKYGISELSDACIHYIATEMMKWHKLNLSQSNASNDASNSSKSSKNGMDLNQNKILLLLLPFVFEFERYKITDKIRDILNKLCKIGEHTGSHRINKFDMICLLNDALFLKIPSLNILDMLYQWIADKFNLKTIDIMTNDVNLRLNDQLWKCTINWYNHNKYQLNYHFKDIKPLLQYVDLTNLTINNQDEQTHQNTPNTSNTQNNNFSNNQFNSNTTNNPNDANDPNDINDELRQTYLNHYNSMNTGNDKSKKTQNDAFLQRIFSYKSSMAHDELSAMASQINAEMNGSNNYNNKARSSIAEETSIEMDAIKNLRNEYKVESSDDPPESFMSSLHRKRKRRVDRRHLIKPSFAKQLAKQRNSAESSEFVTSPATPRKGMESNENEIDNNNFNNINNYDNKNSYSGPNRKDLILSNKPSLDIKRYSKDFTAQPLRQDEIERLRYDDAVLDGMDDDSSSGEIDDNDDVDEVGIIVTTKASNASNASNGASNGSNGMGGNEKKQSRHRSKESLHQVSERMQEIQNEMRFTLNVASQLALEKTPDIASVSDLASDRGGSDGSPASGLEMESDANNNINLNEGDINDIHLRILQMSNTALKQNNEKKKKR